MAYPLVTGEYSFSKLISTIGVSASRWLGIMAV